MRTAERFAIARDGLFVYTSTDGVTALTIYTDPADAARRANAELGEVVVPVVVAEQPQPVTVQDAVAPLRGEPRLREKTFKTGDAMRRWLERQERTNPNFGGAQAFSAGNWR